MRIIISPAKKMKIDMDMEYYNLPRFINEAEILKEYLKGLSYEQVKSIWKCNDKIATENYQRLQRMDLYAGLTPALFSYEGLQYKYMAPDILETKELNYIEEHLRIMSGFYGILKPFDGVRPYRLEMQSKLNGNDLSSLYDFWSNKLAEQLSSESDCIVNLASKEYSKCISKYLSDNVRFVTCVFAERKGDKLVEKGTLAKMARGQMVRYMAENQIIHIEDIKKFGMLDYSFSEESSDKNTFVFIKKETLDVS